MLFKLVSNGDISCFELDGKTFIGVKAISFNHEKRDGQKNQCTVAVEFDITANTSEERLNHHAIMDAKPGDFEKRLKSMIYMFEDPETKGKELPETQAVIDMMNKAAGVCEVPAADKG